MFFQFANYLLYHLCRFFFFFQQCTVARPKAIWHTFLVLLTVKEIKLCCWLSWPLFILLLYYYCIYQHFAFLKEHIWIYPSFLLVIFFYKVYLYKSLCTSLRRVKLWNAVSDTHMYKMVCQKTKFEHSLDTWSSQSHIQINGCLDRSASYTSKKSTSYSALSVSVCFISRLFWGSMSVKSTALFLIPWFIRL